MSYVEYASNNSGGDWWVTDTDWKKLEAAGWIIMWLASKRNKSTPDGKNYVRSESGMPIVEDGIEAHSYTDEDGRFLGALATTAYREGLSLKQAAEEWERILGKSALEAGCPCCGPPHSFTEYDSNGKWVDSGPSTSYSAEW